MFGIQVKSVVNHTSDLSSALDTVTVLVAALVHFVLK